MFEFLMVVFATFTMVMFVLGLLPFRIPGRMMPLALAAAGYGCMELYGRFPAEIKAAAVAGGVAFLSRYAVAQLPEPWSLDDLLGYAITWMPQRRPKRHVRARHRPSRVPSL